MIFTYTCLTLEDFCEIHGLSYDDAVDNLMGSDYSWGSNDDTLVKYENLCYELDTRPESGYHRKGIMVSLGG